MPNEPAVPEPEDPPSRAVAVGASRSPTPIKVFICYRRTDGAWHAGWLHEKLQGKPYDAEDGTPFEIDVYFDKAAPGVADWKQLHFPSLETSQALVVVCTPGIAKDLSSRGRPDWVYEELNWWFANRDVAPIVIDATGEGERWMPHLLRKKWPNVNRIELIREQLDRATDAAVEAINQRIIRTLLASGHETVFEDLERARRLNRNFLVASVAGGLLLLALMVLLVMFVVKSGEQRDANEQLGEAIAEQTRQEAKREEAEGLNRANNAALIAKDMTGILALTQADALLLAIQAYKEAATPVTHVALAEILGASPRPECVLRQPGRLTKLAVGTTQLLATGTEDGTIRAWNLQAGREVGRLQALVRLRDLAFSPMRKEFWILFGPKSVGPSPDIPLRLWNGETTDPKREISLLNEPASFIESPGDPLLRSRAGVSRIVQAGEEVLAANAHRDAGAVSNGTFVAYPNRLRNLEVMNIASRQIRVPFKPFRVTSLALSEGGILVAGGSDGETRTMDVSSGKLGAVHEGPAEPTSLALSPDGTFVAELGMDGDINIATIWRVANGQNTSFKQRVKRSKGFLERTLFSPDSSLAVLAAGDGPIRWLRRKEDEYAPIGAASWGSPVKAMALQPGTERLITADEAGRIILWSPPSPALAEHRGVLQVAVPPVSGSTRYVMATRTTVDVYDTKTPGERKASHSLDGVSPVVLARFDSTGRHLALASGEQLLVLDLQNGNRGKGTPGGEIHDVVWTRSDELVLATNRGVRRVALPSFQVTTLRVAESSVLARLSGDASLVYESDWSGKVQVGNLVTGGSLSIKAGPLFGPAQFDEHRHLVVRIDEHTIQVMDPIRGTVFQAIEVTQPEGNAWHDARLHKLAISDGSTVLLLDTDHPQKQPARISSSRGAVTDLTFSPTKPEFAVSYADGAIEFFTEMGAPTRAFPRSVGATGIGGSLTYTADGRYLIVRLEGEAWGLMPVEREDIIGEACRRSLERRLPEHVWNLAFPGREQTDTCVP